MSGATAALVLLFPLTAPATQSDSLPQMTLGQALQRAAQVDPNYVAALRDITDAAWSHRSAQLLFVLPSLSFQSSATKFSNDFFNVGVGRPTSQIVDMRLEARYQLFRGGGKFFDLGRANAELARARADAVNAQFQNALFTESDYYEVVAQRELTQVAQERVRRAEEQMAVARARVLSGAAVQTDSLQLLLELTRAQVDLLQQRAALRVARFQLGRRVGEAGPVDAATHDTLPARALPITEQEARQEALAQSPRSRAARAGARAASASVRSATSAYLPQVDLFGQFSAFDDSFIPTATTRGTFGVQINVPLWDRGQRELTLTRAKSQRDVSEAVRRDTELAVQRDVVEAYEAYNTARASADLAARSALVARENLRVQQQRYRAGATTIIDLIIAQVAVSEAEAALVQARHATRLALAGLEAILGRRLLAP